ncbi:MAG: 30S ribosomal protein S24e [Candidatus Diapherotrites archaeon]|nr:30S ribosomal protein S24e [Candidatus Diapherotrites archaeon]
MNVEITKEVQNPLLHRTDVYFKVIDSPVTPTRHDVKKKIIALKNADPARVVVDAIKQESGKKESIGYAKVYETEDFMNKIESNYKVKRNTFEAKEQASEKSE